jgi:hypothetical protein
METILNKNTEGYGYKYTDIAEIHRYLEENNMKYYQEVETNEINGQDYIMTYRFINGEWEEKPKRGCKVVDATLQGIKNPAQEQGSALTYARRYSLLMAFGLATEDDDAQSLTRPKKEATTEEVEWQVSEKVSDIEAKTIYNLLINKNKDISKFLNYYKIKNTNELTKTQYVEALKMLEGGN